MATPMPHDLWSYRARLARVVDGDTLIVEIDCGFSTYRRDRVRLLGVDAPEARGSSKPAGDAATYFVAAWLAAAERGDWPLLIRTEKTDNFGRYLALVWRADTGECLNDALLAAGQAAPYEV